MPKSVYEYFNPASIRDAAGDSLPMLEKVSNLAITTLQEQMASCDRAIDARDADAWERALHSLKGSLSLLEAHRALGQLHLLEKLDVTSPNSDFELDMLRSMIVSIERELQQLIVFAARQNCCTA
jgi:HPt (histidine-containing phosphotransfer) domain-containing protein